MKWRERGVLLAAVMWLHACAEAPPPQWSEADRHAVGTAFGPAIGLTALYSLPCDEGTSFARLMNAVDALTARCPYPVFMRQAWTTFKERDLRRLEQEMQAYLAALPPGTPPDDRPLPFLREGLTCRGDSGSRDHILPLGEQLARLARREVSPEALVRENNAWRDLVPCLTPGASFGAL